MPPKIFEFDEFLISRISSVSMNFQAGGGGGGGEGGQSCPVQFNWAGLIDNAGKQTSTRSENNTGPQTSQHEYWCLVARGGGGGLYMDQMRVNICMVECVRTVRCPLYTAPSPVTRSANRPTTIIRTSTIQIGPHHSACSALLPCWHSNEISVFLHLSVLALSSCQWEW